MGSIEKQIINLNKEVRRLRARFENNTFQKHDPSWFLEKRFCRVRSIAYDLDSWPHSIEKVKFLRKLIFEESKLLEMAENYGYSNKNILRGGRVSDICSNYISKNL